MSAFLLATAMAVAPSPAAPTHTVAPSESLTWIAECELGDPNRMTEIIELNAQMVTDPDIIQPGWQLVLPEDASGACPEQPPARSSAAPSTPASNTATSKRESGQGHSHSPGQAQVQAQAAAPRTGAGGGLGEIRACESGGDYGAVSSNGRYRGAYQFDRQTWASVGGSGDPAAASPAEQDQRARVLQQQRGSSPWPSCG